MRRGKKHISMLLCLVMLFSNFSQAASVYATDVGNINNADISGDVNIVVDESVDVTNNTSTTEQTEEVSEKTTSSENTNSNSDVEEFDLEKALEELEGLLAEKNFSFKAVIKFLLESEHFYEILTGLDEETTDAFIEKLTQEDLYQLILYCKYAFVDEMIAYEENKEDSKESDMEKMGSYVDVYVKIVSAQDRETYLEMEDETIENLDEEAFNNITAGLNEESVKDFDSYIEYLITTTTFPVYDTVIQLEGYLWEEDTTAWALELKKYFYATFGFDDLAEKLEESKNEGSEETEREEKETTETGDSTTYATASSDTSTYVFVDGTNGSDSNSGASKAKAFKTMKKAYTKLKSTGGRIVICGAVTSSGTITYGSNYYKNGSTTINLASGKYLDIRRQSAYTGYLFKVTGGTLTLDDIYIRGYNVASSRQMFYVTGGTLNIKGAYITSNAAIYGGGAIYNNGGTVTMSSGTITNCSVTKSDTSNAIGGAVNNASGSTFNMTGGTISNCTVTSTSTGESYGGGVYNAGTFNLSGGTITGNTAEENGAGIYNKGTLNITGGTVSSNTTTREQGGGIYIASTSASASIKNATIKSNTSYASGGGIFTLATTTITDTTIAENIAGPDSHQAFGGGIYNGAKLTVQSCNINNNSSRDGGGGIYTESREDISTTGSCSVNNTTITGNKITKYGGGGAIELYGGNGTITSGSITNNTASYGGGISVTGSTLTTNNVTISNNTATTYDGGGIDSGILSESDITGNVTSTPSTVTMTGGEISSNTATRNGGGVSNEKGELNVSGVKVLNNTGTSGGGIYNKNGTLKVTNNSSVSNNSATTYGGGIYNYGASASLTVTDGEVSTNTSEDLGGGVMNHNGTATLSCTINSNTTVTSGGGIYNYGTLTVTGGAISNNIATDSGGGVYNVKVAIISGGEISKNTGINGGGIYSQGTSLTVTNASIKENNATNSGGAIYSINNPLDIDKATITGNTAGGEGGGVYATKGSPTIENSTISNNESNDNGGGVFITNAETFTINETTIESNSANEAKAGGLYVHAEYLNVTNVDVIKNKAYDYGGVYIGGSDGTISGGEISQNEASNNGGGICINDASSLEDYDAHMKLTDVKILNNTAGNNAGGFYQICTPGTELNNVTITGNTAGNNGGGIYNGAMLEQSIGDVKISENTAKNGGGIYNYRTLTVTGGEITKNQAEEKGGGIYNEKTLNINDGEISNNTSSEGGGVYNYITTNMSGGTVSNNTAEYGGGIHNDEAIINMSNGTISGNTATEDGGGIYNIYDAELYMTNGTIKENKATANGGGVYNSASVFEMSGGTVLSNTADNFGDGVYNSSNAFEMSSGAVINTNNDIYLNSFYVKVSGALTSSGVVGKITPKDYTVARVCVRAAYSEATGSTVIDKYTLTPNGDSFWVAGDTLDSTSSVLDTDVVIAEGYAVTYDANGGSGAPNAQTKVWNKTLTLSSDEPTRAGYTFNNWSGSDGKTYAPGGTYSTDEVLTLTAQWTGNSYEVKFNGNGSTSGSMSNQDFTYGTAQSLTANAFKRAYTVTYNYNGSGASNTTATATATFNGWATSASGAKVYSDKQSVSNLATSGTYNLYANWTLGKVTLPTPTRTGYTFTGWYDAASGGNKIGDGGASYTPAANKTLYAQWTANSFEVKFNGNGATSGSMSNQAFTYDKAQNLTANAFKRAYTVTYNYNGNGASNTTATATATFNGWATSASGSKVYNDKQSVSNLATSGTYNLYANWTLGKVTLPTPTRTGYTFTGWNTKADGTGTSYSGGASLTPSANTTLYAQWKANTYTVQYNGNGNTGGSTASSSHTYDVEKALTANGFTKTGYTFNGWNTKADGTGSAYADKAAVKNLVTSGTVTLYAQWKANTYTISYNGNGNTSGSTASSSHTYDVEKALTANGFAKTGYTFNGWNTKADGTGTTYANKATVKNLATSGTVTLYAQWKANTYTVQYNGNGNTGGATASSSHTYDVEKALTANGFTKTGYTFNGWNTKADGTGTAYADKAAVKNLATSGSITLYAQWTINSYTLKIDPNGGYRKSDNSTAVISVTKNYGASESISERARTGYTLVGYIVKNTDNGSTTDIGGATFTFNSSTKVGTFVQGTKPITLTAQWTPNIYKVTLNNQGAETAGTPAYWYQYKSIKIINGETVYYYTDSSCTTPLTGYTITKPTKTGYTFGGYYTGTNGSGTQYVNAAGQCVNNLYSAVAADTTLYAKWIPNTYTVKYDGNGNTGGSTASSSHTYDIEKVLTANGFTKKGYTFTGWNTKADGSGTAYANQASVKNLTSTNGETITLFAQWKANADTAYKVQHWQQNVDGNANSHDSTNYTLVETETLAGTTGGSVSPAVKSYTGFTAPAKQTVTIKDDGSLVVNYYYTRNSYKVTINKGTGISSVSGAGTYLYGKSVTISASTSMGYTWSKWSGTHDIADQSYTFTMPAGNVTDTANAVANTYTVKYDGNGASSGSTASSSHTYDVEKALTANGFAKKGYTFTGWNTKADGSGTAYADKEAVKNLSAANGATVTLYAQWKANTYTIEYDANGGSGEMESHTVNFGSSIKIKDNGFTAPRGQKFAGWTTKSDGTNDGYGWSTSTGAGWSGTWSYVDGQYGIANKTLKLYARWTPETYTIEYNANGGSGAMDSHTVSFGSSIKIKDNEFTAPTGYEFIGWTTNSDGTNDGHGWSLSTGAGWSGTWNYVDGQYGIANKMLKLYARWKANTYTVKYDGNGAEGSTASSSHTYDIEKTLTSNGFTKTGYTFTGWNTKADGTGTSYADKAAVKNLSAANGGTVTLYAQWKANTYTVQYDGNGNTGGSTAASSHVYDVEKELTANGFTKTGYTFTGWNTKKDGSGTSYEDKASVKNLTATNGATVTLYAQWEAMNIPPEITDESAGLKFYEGEIVEKQDLLADLSAKDSEGSDLTDEIRITKIEYSEGKLLPDGSKTTSSEVVEWENDMPDEYMLDTWFLQMDKEDSPVTHKIYYEVTDKWGNTSSLEREIQVIYNEFPEIKGENFYFTVKDAKEGKITYDVLLEKARAWDKEDCGGHCPSGENCLDDSEPCEFTADNIKILDWDKDLFKNYTDSSHEGPGYQVLTYHITDQYGKETFKQFAVYIISDGEVEQEEDVPIIRFIDLENYQKGSEEEGGLCADSLWYKDFEYADLLRPLLQGIDQETAAAQSSWKFDYGEVDNVKEYIKANGIGNSLNVDGLSGFIAEFK